MVVHPKSGGGATGRHAIQDELAAEQAHIDEAYDRLEELRSAAAGIRRQVEVGSGGTFQAHVERDALTQAALNRLNKLDLGDASLVFGRLDLAPGRTPATEERSGSAPVASGGLDEAEGDTFHVGRLAVNSATQDPLVVDWRAPAAEPFYRATGVEPMGLARRRHFATRGRRLLGIDDEFFGRAAAERGIDGSGLGATEEVSGRGALVASLEAERTGRLGDIVATIQGEQDQIIRSALAGLLIVQGGPGTGKTVVALHRAAYLLYTHRFPLEGQGVLVVGPNRLFLAYIERVLPSLGEAGVELSVLADLIERVRLEGRDGPVAARLKGDLQMVGILERAVADRQRPLREPFVVPFGLQYLRLDVTTSADIVAEARRRSGTHNGARRHVERRVRQTLVRSARSEVDPDAVREHLMGSKAWRAALDWMWPVLTPAQLLRDLFGSRALLASAAPGLDRAQRRSLHRERSEHVDQATFTTDDVPVLDEAFAILGPRPKRADRDEIRTYGHIVVDEAQDLSPMQLRMLSRRSLNGSMTIVGDIAQSTGAWAHNDWDEIATHLPDHKGVRTAELTIGYRSPGALMGPANAVLREAAPELVPPRPVRTGGDPPRSVAAAREALGAVVARTVIAERAQVSPGTVAVICARSMAPELEEALDAAGIEFGRATRHGLRQEVTVVPVDMVKGLELDAAVLVEPARMLAEEPQPMRSLYVGLTRATKRLTIVHGRELPAVLAAVELLPTAPEG